MKPFIVIACLVLAAMAKPQGYSYNSPAPELSVALLPPHVSSGPSNSAPSFSHGLASSHGSLGLAAHSSGGSLSLGSSYSVAPSASLGSSYSVAPSSSFSSYNNVPSGSFGSVQSGSFGSVQSGSFGSAPSASFSSVSSGSFGSAPSVLSPAPVLAPPVASFSFAPSQPAPSSNTLIQKHIYVHVPPPDEEDYRTPLPQLSQPNRQKHYKIIFIKAPTGPSVSQQIAQAQLAQQQLLEEKTLVYVLVKKPESIEDLQQNIPRIPLTQPNKPEVYFIKYKAQSGGLSAPIPLSSVHSTSDFSLSGLSAPQQTTVLSPQPAAENSSSVVAAAAAAASTSSAEASSSGSLALGSNTSDAATVASIAAVIQPRKPAAEYGPPH